MVGKLYIKYYSSDCNRYITYIKESVQKQLVVCVMLMQVCLETLFWTAVNQLFVVASLLAYFAVVFTLSSADMFLLFTASFPFVGENVQQQQGAPLQHPQPEMTGIKLELDFFSPIFCHPGVASSCLRQPTIWLTLLLTFALCMLPSLALRFLQVLLWPSVSDKVRRVLQIDLQASWHHVTSAFPPSVLLPSPPLPPSHEALPSSLLHFFHPPPSFSFSPLCSSSSSILLLQVRHRARQEVTLAPPTAPAARQRRASRRRSSYAFSHSQGFGNLLTSRRGLGLRALRTRPGLLSHNWDSSDGSLAAGVQHQK